VSDSIKNQLIEFQKKGLLPESLSKSIIANTIQVGSVFLIPIEEEKKYIKDKKNNTPGFIKNSKHEWHPWLFLRPYSKDSSLGLVRVVNRSTIKTNFGNVADYDYPQTYSHNKIDKDHPRSCLINEQGVYKNNLKQYQKLDVEFLNSLDEDSKHFNCIEPEIDLIIKILDEEDVVYD